MDNDLGGIGLLANLAGLAIKGVKGAAKLGRNALKIKKPPKVAAPKTFQPPKQGKSLKELGEPMTKSKPTYQSTGQVRRPNYGGKSLKDLGEPMTAEGAAASARTTFLREVKALKARGYSTSKAEQEAFRSITGTRTNYVNSNFTRGNPGARDGLRMSDLAKQYKRNIGL